MILLQTIYSTFMLHIMILLNSYFHLKQIRNLLNLWRVELDSFLDQVSLKYLKNFKNKID